MRKPTKKSRVLMVLPTQIAVLEGADAIVGYLDKMNTETPEFLMETPTVTC